MNLNEIKIQRFRIPKGISQRLFILDPHPEGEWVSYVDCCKAIETILKAQPAMHLAPIPCGVKVEIENSKGIAHTYCMKPLGHEGKHDTA